MEIVATASGLSPDLYICLLCLSFPMPPLSTRKSGVPGQVANWTLAFSCGAKKQIRKCGWEGSKTKLSVKYIKNQISCLKIKVFFFPVRKKGKFFWTFSRRRSGDAQELWWNIIYKLLLTETVMLPSVMLWWPCPWNSIRHILAQRWWGWL